MPIQLAPPTAPVQAIDGRDVYREVRAQIERDHAAKGGNVAQLAATRDAFVRSAEPSQLRTLARRLWGPNPALRGEDLPGLRAARKALIAGVGVTTLIAVAERLPYYSRLVPFTRACSIVAFGAFLWLSVTGIIEFLRRGKKHPLH